MAKLHVRRLGLARTLWTEGRWRPETTARFTWDSDFGRRTDNGIGFGDGFHELEGALSFISREDPLVFFGTLGYRARFEDGGTKPGDQVRVNLGSVVALSPTASLSVSSDNIVFEETEVGGSALRGSDGLAASISLGASVVLTRRALLNITGSVGVTDDAADYALSLSVPVRFGP